MWKEFKNLSCAQRDRPACIIMAGIRRDHPLGKDIIMPPIGCCSARSTLPTVST
jgi:hypothetical protein